jgi:hypothetical protein
MVNTRSTHLSLCFNCVSTLACPLHYYDQDVCFYIEGSMSRRSISRSAKREKQKTLHALIALGLTSSAFAAVAATLVWAWSPNGGNWTLSPQQDFAESGKIPAAGKGHAWVPPEVPPVTPWATIPTSADTTVAGNQISGETQIASVDTKDGNSSGHGPMDYGSQNDGGGNVDHLFGLFSSGGNGNPNGGGQGSSWNGTFNPNAGRGFGGGGGGGGGYYPGAGGGGGDDDICKGANAQNFEKCKTTTPTVAGIKKDDGDNNQDNNSNNNSNSNNNNNNDSDDNNQNNENNNQSNNNQNNNNNNNQEDPPEIIVGNDPPHPPAAPQQLVAVPEPGSLLMFSVALLGLGWFVRRRA